MIGFIIYLDDINKVSISFESHSTLCWFEIAILLNVPPCIYLRIL